MMRTDEKPEERPDPISDRRLWQRSRLTDAPDDEASHFLDLAAFADGRLDDEERDRVGALVAADPEAAADVRAARGAPGPEPAISTGLERIVARAAAIPLDPPSAEGCVVPFAPRKQRRLVYHF